MQALGLSGGLRWFYNPYHLQVQGLGFRVSGLGFRV